VRAATNGNATVFMDPCSWIVYFECNARPLDDSRQRSGDRRNREDNLVSGTGMAGQNVVEGMRARRTTTTLMSAMTPNKVAAWECGYGPNLRRREPRRSMRRTSRRRRTCHAECGQKRSQRDERRARGDRPSCRFRRRVYAAGHLGMYRAI